MADRNTSGLLEPTTRTTRRNTGQQPSAGKTTGKLLAVSVEDGSEEDSPTPEQQEIARLNAQIARLMREAAAAQDQPVPTTETPPTMPDQPAPQYQRYLSATPEELGRFKLSERTPAIENLSDGIDPTFRQ